MVSLVSSVIGVIKDFEKRNGTAVWRFHYFFVPLQTVRGGIRDKVNKKYVLIMASTVLNEAQMSILRLLGSMKTVEEVDELRQVICDYYARRVDEEVDKLWESGQWDDEKNEAVLKEHLRTPYKYAK